MLLFRGARRIHLSLKNSPVRFWFRSARRGNRAAGRFYDLIQEHNPILHLVGPMSAEEFAIRHVLESLDADRLSAAQREVCRYRPGRRFSVDPVPAGARENERRSDRIGFEKSEFFARGSGKMRTWRPASKLSTSNSPRSKGLMFPTLRAARSINSRKNCPRC